MEENLITGRLASRIYKYYQDLARRDWQNNLDFWIQFVKTHYNPGAVMRLEYLKSKEEKRSYVNKYDCLPNLLKTNYDHGVKLEKINMTYPREYLLDDDHYFLESLDTSISTEYADMVVIHKGTLYVVFDKDLKIKIFEFQSKKHEEFIKREALIEEMNGNGIVNLTQLNDIGLTAEFARCLLTSEVIGDTMTLNNLTRRA